MATELEQELTDMLTGTLKEIRAWRSGVNYRNMNKAKVGATYLPEWFITDLLAKARVHIASTSPTAPVTPPLTARESALIPQSAREV